MVAGGDSGDIGKGVAGYSGRGGDELCEGVLGATGGDLEDVANRDKSVVIFMK